MKIKLINKYEAFNVLDIELPEGKTADDILDVHTKWTETTIEFVDGEVMTFYDPEDPEVDCKRPVDYEIEEIKNG